jgi:hypothetical protein
LAKGDNIETKNIYATISQGEIKKEGDNFIAKVFKVGDATINFYTIENGKRVDLKQTGFKVRVVPEQIILSSEPVKLPEISISDLRKSGVYKLLQLEEGTEIVSYKFSINKPADELVEINNKGNLFNDATKMQIANATTGNTIVIDQIRIIKDGLEKNIPAKAYAVTD